MLEISVIFIYIELLNLMVVCVNSIFCKYQEKDRII